MEDSIEETKPKKRSLYFIGTILILVGLVFAFRDVLSQKVENILDPKPLVKEFTITIEDSQFTPDNITVSEGDEVKITARNLDEENHGIAIDQFRIWKEVPREEETTIEFVADKKGTYKMYCSVTCSGHMGMKGNLIVE